MSGSIQYSVGRPYEVSLAPPCPELFCELRGLCRHSEARTRGRGHVAEVKTNFHRVFGVNPGFQRFLPPAAGGKRKMVFRGLPRACWEFFL